MVKWYVQTRVVVQDRWGGVCQNAQEMGNSGFLLAQVLLDVSACEETATAREGYFAGIDDRGAHVRFHGFRRFGNEPAKDAFCRGWAFAHLSAQLCCLAHSEGLAKSIEEVADEGCARSLHVEEVHRFLRPGEGGGGLFRRSRSR